jgi:hypothetical protein
MSKLTAVIERVAHTKRWLDQEADRLAARLDQLEKRAPAVILNAHRILDDQQKGLDATEKLIQQWVSLASELSTGPEKPRVSQHAGASQSSGTQHRQSNDGVPAGLEPVRRLVDEQHKDVGRLERALQVLAGELPEPQDAGADQGLPAQPRQSNASAMPDPARPSLEDEHKDEGGLERALQTLANKSQASQHNGTGQLSLARFKQSNDDAGTPVPIESPPRLLEESQSGDDVSKPAPRTIGAIRAA